MGITREKFDQIVAGIEYNNLFANETQVVMDIGHFTELYHTTFHRLNAPDKVDTSILVNSRPFKIRTQRQLKDIISIRKIYGDTIGMVNRIEQYMIDNK